MTHPVNIRTEGSVERTTKFMVGDCVGFGKHGRPTATVVGFTDDSVLVQFENGKIESVNFLVVYDPADGPDFDLGWEVRKTQTILEE